MNGNGIRELIEKYGYPVRAEGEKKHVDSLLKKQPTFDWLKTPKFYTPEEAKTEFDFDVYEGWMLKLTPDTSEVGFHQSLINPKGEELGFKDVYITPAGDWASMAELETQYAGIEGFETDIDEVVTGLSSLVGSMDELEKRLAGDMPVPERMRFEKELAGYDIEFDEYVKSLKEIGRTPETEAILRLEGMPEEEIGGFFLPEEKPEVAEQFQLSKEEREVIYYDRLKEIDKETLEKYPELKTDKWGRPIWANQDKALYEEWMKERTAAFNLWQYGYSLEGEHFTPEKMFEVTGRGLLQLPRQLAASILQAFQGEGGASVVNRDWADIFIEDAEKDISKFVDEMRETYGVSIPPYMASLPQNLAYSLTSMGSGLGVGVPIGHIPVPGARVAAYTLGTAASGAVAYRMTTYQIVQQYLELKDEEKITETGKGITLEEENQLKDEFHTLAVKYGLWEAVPEAISNLAFVSILTAPLTSMLGKNIATQIVSKIVGIYGQELLTETITQKGQSRIEVEAGLREGNISWAEAFKEIAPQTFLLVTIMGGAGQTIISSQKAIKAIKTSLNNEIGETSPLYEGYLEEAEKQYEKVSDEVKQGEAIPRLTPEMTEEWRKRGIPEAEAGVEMPEAIEPMRAPEMPVEGVYRKGDVFTTPEGEVTLSLWAESERKWQVTKPDGTETRMTIEEIDKLVAEKEWGYKAKELPIAPGAEVSTAPEVHLQEVPATYGKKFNFIVDNKVVGAVDYREIEGLGKAGDIEGIMIVDIEVIPEMKRKGIASKVLNKILSEAEAQNKTLYSGVLKPEGQLWLEGLEKQGVIKLAKQEQKLLGYSIERAEVAKPTAPGVKPTIPKAEVGMPEAQFKVIGRSLSGEANILQTSEGIIIKRLATGKQKGWWKTTIGKTEYVAKTPERALEIAQERGAIPEALPLTEEVEITPEAKKMTDEFNDKRAYELVTEPRPPLGAEPESMPRGTVRHPNFAKGKEDVIREIKQEFYEPFKDSPLGASSAAYLKTGDFAKFIELMPDVGELKLQALSDEIKNRIAELEELRSYILLGRDLVAFEGIIKKLKGGEKLSVEDAVSLGIALRTTKGGRLLPAIRKSGFYVSTEFAEYPKFNDVGYVSGNAMDTYSLFEAIDGGYATGAVQKDILYPTHITHLARDQFSDAYKYKVDKLVEQFGLESDKNMRKETWAIIQEITKEEADFKTAQVLLKPEIQGLVSKYDKETQTKLVEFSQGVRALLDELIAKQNLARTKRGQDTIAYREKYLAWVAETNIWSKLGWHKKTPADFFPKPPLPDYIKPDAPFNPRAMAREGGMAGYEMEKDVRKLLKEYIDTAAKDIFNTNIIHNAKIHVAALKSMGYPSSSKLIQDRLSQSYAGTLSGLETGIRGVVPIRGLKAMWFVRRQLTRAVFPLNWMWNVTIQPSSIAFTIARTGVRNTMKGLSYLFDSGSRAYVRERYSWIIKSRRGGKMAYQDIGMQVSGNLWVEGSIIDKAEHIGNFLTNTIEEKLTGISIIAGYHKGKQLGYTGIDLDEYASKMGAKTQSMYNFEDLPGVLQSKTIGSVFPFQTFCFQAFNFVREMNIIGIRKGVGKAGAYETMSAKSAEGQAVVAQRLKMTIEFLAIMFVINMVVDKATNRKPWRISSFIPFYSNLIAGMDASNSWNWPLPVQYVSEFWNGFQAVIKYDSWDKLRKWLVRYHMLGGTQINRSIEGVIALVHGEVTDARGKQMFEVKPEEWLKLIAMGPYASEQGRDYVDRLKEKKGKWYEYVGFPLPSRVDINDEIDKNLELLGKTDEEGAPYDFGDFVSDLREIRRVVGEKRFSISISPFIDGFLKAEASREEFEKLPPKDLDNMDADDISGYIFPEADPDSAEITTLWTDYNGLKTEQQKRDFIADYIKSHSDELKDNIVAKNYYLLEDMWLLVGKDLKAFLEKYPDLNKNWRSDWRKERPKDDALLAMWGYGGRIQTQEAYDFISGWCGELGINEEHLSTWLPPEGSEENYFKFQGEMLRRSWNSWEAQLILAEDDNLREALGYDPIETPVEALRLQVKWREESDLRDAWGDRESPLYIVDDDERQTKYDWQYANNPEFRDDMRRVEGYGHDFTDDMIENYVEYSNLPQKGYDQERYLLEHGGEDLENPTGFYKAMIDLKDKVPFDLDYKVPEAKYDSIYWEWEDSFIEYDTLDKFEKKFEAEHDRMPTESERKAERLRLLTENEDFRKDRRRREAYDKFIPEEFVEDYVGYFEVPPKSADDWFVNFPSEVYYGEEWFLDEHRKFYGEVWIGILGKEEVDFDKLPTKKVYKKYRTYLEKESAKSRLWLRCQNEDLDDWLHDAKGLKRAYGTDRCLFNQ